MDEKFDKIRDLIKQCEVIVKSIKDAEPLQDEESHNFILSNVKVFEGIIKDQITNISNATTEESDERKDIVISVLEMTLKNLKKWEGIYQEYKGDEDNDDIGNFNAHESKKTISKSTIHQGKMHKILGIELGKKIADKYKTGESLYHALNGKLKDHGKAMKMIAYAANISKEKDIFDAAMRYGKEHNPNN